MHFSKPRQELKVCLLCKWPRSNTTVAEMEITFFRHFFDFIYSGRAISLALTSRKGTLALRRTLLWRITRRAVSLYRALQNLNLKVSKHECWALHRPIIKSSAKAIYVLASAQLSNSCYCNVSTPEKQETVNMPKGKSSSFCHCAKNVPFQKKFKTFNDAISNDKTWQAR